MKLSREILEEMLDNPEAIEDPQAKATIQYLKALIADSQASRELLASWLQRIGENMEQVSALQAIQEFAEIVKSHPALPQKSLPIQFSSELENDLENKWSKDCSMTTNLLLEMFTDVPNITVKRRRYVDHDKQCVVEYILIKFLHEDIE